MHQKSLDKSFSQMAVKWVKFNESAYNHDSMADN